ncbi:MAG: hypothetical protein M0008_03850 [Actinomycetota bacterium]|nr:hypothetical protein [Actinomycetota bacterium]
MRRLLVRTRRFASRRTSLLNAQQRASGAGDTDRDIHQVFAVIDENSADIP